MPSHGLGDFPLERLLHPLLSGRHHQGFPWFSFFLKIYFYYFFIGKADIQRGETERKIFHPMIHSPSERKGPILCRSEARSLFRVSHAGAGSQSFGPSSTAFPGHRQGPGREAGLPVPIWDPGRARRGPLTTCATAPGPISHMF